jgi:pimeloyl-ACP methyl ester carboxylesterase
VVLVHGSGPNDRDESVGQTKLFRDLAWALAQNGMAVLRYDKRTNVYGEKIAALDPSSFTVEEETVQDAILAAKLLKADPRFNAEKTFLIGHSMGAMLGPRIATESEGLFAGLVLVSGTPLLLTDIILAQNEDGLAKLPEDQRAAQQPLVDAEQQKLKTLSAATAEEAKALTVFGIPGYYLYEMGQFDAAKLTIDLHLPTFILQGGKDFQVSVANGYDAWQKALGKQDFITYELYPELNHLMMAYTGDPALQGTVAEYNTPANVDPTVTQDIIGWILSH